MEKYESSDLMLAAALMANGMVLFGTKDYNGYITFTFDDPRRCKELESKWWAGELSVIASRYAECAKRLKGLVYSTRR